MSSCSVLPPEIVMHDDAYIGGRSENNIKCVMHDDLGEKNQTTRYILPRHWLYEWFSQFHSCGTYSVLSRSPSICFCLRASRLSVTDHIPNQHPTISQIFGDHLPAPVRFDLERPRGRDFSVPKILGLPACTHTVWKTTTYFCIVIKLWGKFFLPSWPRMLMMLTHNLFCGS